MLKIAVIGCGAIATYKYLPILQGMEKRVKLVAICDLNEEILKKVANQFRFPNSYNNVSDLLSEQHPDVVIVCTPPKTHADLVILALRAGAHVLVEKPMAVNVGDCNRMNETAKECDRKLGVMHSQLFHPPVLQILKDVSTGLYGDFLGMRILLATGRDTWISEPNHWAHKLRGGVVGETGPHAVYLSLAFLKNVRDVQVRLAKHNTGYPWLIGDDIRFDLIADNGISSVVLDYGSNQTTAELDIMCTQQFLRVDLQSRIVVKHNRPVKEDKLSTIGVSRSVMSASSQRMVGLINNGLRYYSSKSLDGHYVGINEFLDYVISDKPFPSTGEEGQQAIAVLGQVVEKLEELRNQNKSP
jgi:predicted dehydrogenase